MEIKQEVFPESVRPKRIHRSGNVTLQEGENITLAVKGSKRIDANVPPGKIWEIQVILELTEKDA